MEKENDIWMLEATRAASTGDREFFLKSPFAWMELEEKKQATLLFMAAEYGFRDICRMFLDWGAPLNFTYERFTPLCGAARMGDPGIVQDFLCAGAEINGNSDTISSPLIEAVLHRKIQAVCCLVKAGADVNRCQQWSGKTPVDIAQENTLHAIEEYLRAHGGLSSHEISPLAEDEAKPFLQEILRRFGRVLPVPFSFCADRYPVKLWTVIDKKDQKYLLTTGVSAFCEMKTELLMPVPFEWEIYNPKEKNCFYQQLLQIFTKEMRRYGPESLSFDIFPDRLEYRDLSWPKDVVISCGPAVDQPPFGRAGSKRIALYELTVIHTRRVKRLVTA